MNKMLIAMLMLVVASFTGGATAAERTKQFNADISLYSNTMIVTSIVQLGGVQLTDCELAAFDSKGRCRGSELSAVDEEGRVYLLVYGNSAEMLTFKVVDAGGKVYDCEETLSFSVDGVFGDYDTPQVFHASAACDVNKDGVCNIADLAALIHMLCGGNRTPYDQQAADLDGDGTLTLNDVILLRNLLLAP